MHNFQDLIESIKVVRPFSVLAFPYDMGTRCLWHICAATFQSFYLQLENTVRQGMNSTFGKYYRNGTAKNAIDHLQQKVGS